MAFSANYNFLVVLFSFIHSSLIFFSSCCFNCPKAQQAPAVFIFGDSTVDFGNNNCSPFSIARADYPHNVTDFVSQKPTGRFSNGRNPADFFGMSSAFDLNSIYYSHFSSHGEIQGLRRHFVKSIMLSWMSEQLRKWAYQLHRHNSPCCPTKPMDLFLTGANFASAASGIFNETGQKLVSETIKLIHILLHVSGFREVKAACCGMGKLKADFCAYQFQATASTEAIMSSGTDFIQLRQQIASSWMPSSIVNRCTHFLEI